MSSVPIADPEAAVPAARRRWTRPSRSAVLIIAAVVLLLVIPVFIALGGGGVSIGQAASVTIDRILGIGVDSDLRQASVIVWDLRMPRVLMAVLTGAALATSGVVMQGLLRNPLVSPFTLGVSPAAAFGASVAILIGYSAGNNGPSAFWIGTGALIAAFVCSALVLGLGSAKGMSPTTLILLGIALTQVFSALTAAMQLIADENALSAIVRWTFGTVNDATWTDVATIAVLVALVLPYFLWNAKGLNAVAFAGDDAATTMGINVPALRLGLIAASVALAAICVSLTGVIGFVGLVGPHIARLVIGADHRYLIPFAAISGGLLVLVSDAVGRLIVPPTVIPVGIVIAFIGGPIFVNLILKSRSAQA